MADKVLPSILMPCKANKMVCKLLAINCSFSVKVLIKVSFSVSEYELTFSTMPFERSLMLFSFFFKISRMVEWIWANSSNCNFLVLAWVFQFLTSDKTPSLSSISCLASILRMASIPLTASTAQSIMLLAVVNAAIFSSMIEMNWVSSRFSRLFFMPRKKANWSSMLSGLGLFCDDNTVWTSFKLVCLCTSMRMKDSLKKPLKLLKFRSTLASPRLWSNKLCSAWVRLLRTHLNSWQALVAFSTCHFLSTLVNFVSRISSMSWFSNFSVAFVPFSFFIHDSKSWMFENRGGTKGFNCTLNPKTLLINGTIMLSNWLGRMLDSKRCTVQLVARFFQPTKFLYLVATVVTFFINSSVSTKLLRNPMTSWI